MSTMIPDSTGAIERQRFDLALFLALNEEYRSKPLVPHPLKHDPVSLATRGAERAAKLIDRHKFAGARVLEIGCGRGEVSLALAEQHGCDTVGVDIRSSEHWRDVPSRVTFVVRDLSSDATVDDLGRFDVIYSNSVWEHLRHPFTMLQRAYALLNSGGTFLLSANLYRGPKASHRYREVFFPWPHLLFADEIFEAFYLHNNQAPKRPSWINRLSIADYKNYFDLVGFRASSISFSVTPLDEPFYNRFIDTLERYPRYDLERDFIRATLTKAKRYSRITGDRSGSSK
jgi:SAM-dependent methyltransferase